jgi:hypothetical protein
VLALLMGASALLAPVAHAATKSVIVKCTDGDFHGEFKLTYETRELHRLKNGRGGAGPYIGDSGAMNVRVYYREGTTTNTALNRTKSGMKSDEVGEVPVEGTKVPTTGRAWVEVRFSDSSGLRCTGRKNLI